MFIMNIVFKNVKMNHLRQDKEIVIITLWICLIILLLVLFWFLMFLTSCAAKAAHSPFFAVPDSQRALVSHLPPLRKDTN